MLNIAHSHSKAITVLHITRWTTEATEVVHPTTCTDDFMNDGIRHFVIAGTTDIAATPRFTGRNRRNRGEALADTIIDKPGLGIAIENGNFLHAWALLDFTGQDLHAMG